MTAPLTTREYKGIIESLLLSADAPLSIHVIAGILEIEAAAARQIMEELVAEWEQREGGFDLCTVAGGYQFHTRYQYADWIQQLMGKKPVRFSRAAQEVLVIVAYQQPVTRTEIDYLRGVDSGGVLRSLLEKNLIRVAGKKDVPGRPLMYATSRKFLQTFHLDDLKSLPTLREISELTGEGIESLKESVDLSPLTGQTEEL